MILNCYHNFPRHNCFNQQQKSTDTITSHKRLDVPRKDLTPHAPSRGPPSLIPSFTGQERGRGMRPTQNTAQSVVRPNPHHPFLSYLPRSPRPFPPQGDSGKTKTTFLARPASPSCVRLRLALHHTPVTTTLFITLSPHSPSPSSPLSSFSRSPYLFASFVSKTITTIASSSSSVLQQ